MPIRRVASIMLSVLTLLCASTGGAAVCAAQVEQATGVGLIDQVDSKLSELVGEFYRKAKTTKDAKQLKIEYKVRPFVAVGNKQELAPDFGGVMCDIQVRPGPYKGKVRLPQQYNEHNFYSVILMAPYCQAANAHLYTKLLYPSDTPQEFTDRFKEILNEFDDNRAPAEQPSFAAVPRESQNPGSSNVGAGAVETKKQIFWKARRGDELAYILGTIPYRQTATGALVMAGEVKDAYKDAKSILVDTIDLRTSLPYSDKAIRYPDGDKLSMHLSAASRQALDSYLSWSGETMDMYDFWKPWFLSLAFETSLYRLNGFVRVDWEKYIAERARKETKLFEEIEAAPAKTALLESLPEDVQQKLMTLSIKELLNYESIQKKAEAAWRAGDPDSLSKALNSEVDGNPELKPAFDKLLSERTNLISKKLDEALKNQGPVFVAVDARCLVGEAGLIKRLSQSGFSLEQISSAQAGGKVSAAPRDEAAKADFGGTRLSRYTYPEGKFSILLPGKPAMRFTNKTGMRQVEYTYQDTQGAFCVGYIILPGVPIASAIPDAFDATSKGLTTTYQAVESKQAQASLQGYPGRIINMTRLKDKDDWGVHVRMFVVGKMLYILAAEGSMAWLRSPIVGEVTNSLRVTTPEDEQKALIKKTIPTALPGTQIKSPKFEMPQGPSKWGTGNTGRGQKWGADPFGQTSPYGRSQNQWGR